MILARARGQLPRPGKSSQAAALLAGRAAQKQLTFSQARPPCQRPLASLLPETLCGELIGNFVRPARAFRPAPFEFSANFSVETSLGRFRCRRLVGARNTKARLHSP